MGYVSTFAGWLQMNEVVSKFGGCLQMKSEMLMMERPPQAAGMPWDWHLPPRLYRGNLQSASGSSSPRDQPELPPPPTPPSDQKGVEQAAEGDGCDSQPVSPTKMWDSALADLS